jgi:hypothetical protein
MDDTPSSEDEQSTGSDATTSDDESGSEDDALNTSPGDAQKLALLSGRPLSRLHAQKQAAEAKEAEEAKEDEDPKFDTKTGRPLNAAAKRKLRERRGNRAGPEGEAKAKASKPGHSRLQHSTALPMGQV